MTAKEYLSQIREYERSIKALESEVYRLESDMMRISGVDYRRPTAGRRRAFSDVVSASALDEIGALQTKRKEMILSEARARDRIIDQIRGIGPGLYREILTARYIDGLSLQDTADKLSYSLDYVAHAHGKALQEFERRYQASF